MDPSHEGSNPLALSRTGAAAEAALQGEVGARPDVPVPPGNQVFTP